MEDSIDAVKARAKKSSSKNSIKNSLLPEGDEARLGLSQGWIVGLDEVGAGCLAGPLCVAAFAYPVKSELQLTTRVFDSKKLSPQKRDEASVMLKQLPNCIYKLCWIEVPEIESLNIFWARMKAFWTLILEFEEFFKSDANVRYLVDGPRLNRKREITGHVDEFKLIELETRIHAQSKADSVFFAVAAASVLAKVERDSFIGKLDVFSSLYPWEKNKGYATPDHIEAIQKHGLSSHHRKSFCGNIEIQVPQAIPV